MFERHGRRLSRAVVAAILLAGAIGMPSTATAAPALPPQNPGQPRTVTLLTGDRVLISGDSVTPIPAKGREGISFHTYEVGGQHYVVPSDAATALSAGRLDRRLFDVTTLLEFGYDDEHRDSLPLIVTGSGGVSTLAVQAGRALPSISGTATVLRKAEAARKWAEMNGPRALAAAPGKIWLDGLRKPTLAESVPQIGAPQAWQEGYTGKGTTVAVLDSGIDASHPDFAGRIAEARDFTGAGNTDDLVGHGTHVASIIAGSGAASGGKRRGVAPEATLEVGKVCSTDGCSESAIVAGMEWAAAEKHVPVVNLSIGGRDTEEVDPLEAAINNLTAEYGTLFVVAAGNSGSSPGTVESPGTADAALSVGAVDKQDVLAPYSSRGPRLDGAIKPDIAAPGTGIIAARSANSGLPPVDDSYTEQSGTSMAAPHVTGAAALLAQRHPDWHAPELRSALTGSANPTATPDVFAEGSGRVDVARAIRQDVFATEQNMNFGLQRWPHDDDAPVTRTITYHNTGSAPITLTLSTEGGPAGVFASDRPNVTVPAGGAATATVTADTRNGGQDGFNTGRLVATDGTNRIVTPLAVNREAESYDLVVSRIGLDGKPAAVDATAVYNLDSGDLQFPYASDGTVKLRLPKGNYLADSFFDGDTTIHLAQPLLRLDRDTTIVLDARVAKPVEVSVPKASARPALQHIGYRRYVGGQPAFASEILQHGSNAEITPVRIAHLGPELSEKDMMSFVNEKFGEPGPEGDFLNSPYIYHLVWSENGHYFTGFRRQVKDRELATIRQNYRAMTEGRYGYSWTFGFTADFDILTATPLPVTLPFSRDEYYLAEGRRWEQDFHQNGSRQWWDYQTTLAGPTETFRAGRHYERQWNQAVFGPTFAIPAPYGSTRTGDRIIVDIATYGDAGEGRYGYGLSRTGVQTVLYRDGQPVVKTNFPELSFTAPAQESSYRLTVDEQHDETVLPLSSRTTMDWTFRSGHAPDGRTDKLPLLAARFSPQLDEYNRAPAGRPFVVPITVESNAPGSRITQLITEVSYDDGATWQQVPVTKGDDHWCAQLNHPNDDGYVSLRVSAADQAGSQVKQTVIHAYQLKR